MSKIISAKIIDIGRFKAFYFASIPPRIEIVVMFNGETLSQKLVFQMMDISWKHGFGCSSPQFDENGNVLFSIGTILPSSRSLRRYVAKLQVCLEEVADFSSAFEKQFDFSILDISMFDGLDPEDIDISLIAAVRDQKHNGDWEVFRKALLAKDCKEEAEIVGRCQLFEQVNGKDIGLIGSKLLDTLAMISTKSNYQN